MISDPIVTVTCDECGDTIELDLQIKYPDYSGNNGYYTAFVEDIDLQIKDSGWLIRNGKHYCGLACAEEDE